MTSLLLGLALSLSAQAESTTIYCADNAGANRSPRLTVKAGGGYTLFLCAVSARKKKGRLEVSGFKVFSLSKAGKKREKPLFESELANKKFSASARGEELVLNELLFTGKDFVPAYEHALSCDSSGCKAGARTCVYKKPAAGGRFILKTIDEYRHGKRQGKVPQPKLINLLASLAYTGNEEALAIFKDRGGMALDGEASERYYEHQEAIDRLRAAACFP